MGENDTRDAKLRLSVEAKGAKEASREIASIGTSTKDLAAALKSAGDKNALAASAREAKNEFAGLTNEIKGDLTAGLKQAASEADRIRPGKGGGGGSGGGFEVNKFRGVASAVGLGDTAGVIDDLMDAKEGIQGLGLSMSSVLNPATLLVTGAVVAAGAAFHVVTEGIREDQRNLELELDSRRTAAEAAFSGATVSDATAAMEGYNDSIKTQEFLISQATNTAEQEFAQLVRNKEQALGIFADLSARIQTAVGMSKVSTAQADIDKSTDLKQKAEAGKKAYQDLLDQGLFTADELNKAETGLISTRTEAARTIDTAATAERSRAREMMQADRERERAAADMQRQQEQAAREQQQNAEKAASAQQKYSDSIKNAKTTFENTAADLGKKRREGETDVRVSMGRDLNDIALKNAQDVTKAIKEDWRSAREDAIRNADEIDDIRSEAQKSEQEALREGDFRQAYLSKVAGQERLAQEAKTDRSETAERERSLADRRDDLRTSLRDETLARRTAGLRSFDDLKTGLSRELETARTAQQRAAAMAVEARSSDLAGLQGHFNRMTGVWQQYFNKVEGMAGQLVAGGRGAQPAGRSIQQQMSAAVGSIIRR